MKKIIRKTGSLIIFLFVLGVFCFSFYKILKISGVLEKAVFGISEKNSCVSGICDWQDNWCGCDWCWPCPSPTPEEPTPTPEEPTPTLPEEEPTPTPGEEPTPTSFEEEPTSTPSPPIEITPTPTPKPGEPPPPGGNGGPPGPPVCGAEMPEAPTLLSVTPVASVELEWTEVDRATHYSIVYGTSSGDYAFGVPNTGRVTSYLVGNLDPNADYCFAVRAVNDCAPSGLSNEICTGEIPSRGGVLGVTTLAETGKIDWQTISVLGYTLGCLCLATAIKILKKPNLALE